MARPCPTWRHVWQHMHRDVVTSLPSSVSLPLAQSPMALIRAPKSLAGALFCVSTASTVQATGFFRRPRGRGAAAPVGCGSVECCALGMSQQPCALPGCPHHHPAPAEALRALLRDCAVPRPSALHGFGSSPPWDGREQGAGGGESWKRCRKGLVARMHCGNAPEVLPCTAAPSHDGSTFCPLLGSHLPLVFPWPFECGTVEQMANKSGPAEHGCSVNTFS